MFYRKSFYLSLMCMLSLHVIWAQKGMSPGDKLRLSTANDNLRSEYFVAAYEQFQALVRDYPHIPSLKVNQARAGLALHKYVEVLPLLEEAWNQDSTAHADLPLYLGMAYHRNGLLDKAMFWYQKYKSRLKGKDQTRHEVNQYIGEVEIARRSMESPGRVQLRPMSKINTEYMENTACLTEDGRTMIFTTARPENKGRGIDPVVGIPFQDVWICIKDSVTGEWGEPYPLPGEVNTEGHDAGLSISQDGNIIFLFSSKSGGGDIYYSRVKRNNVYRKPVPVEGNINSSYFESSLSLAADGKTAYYISEKPVKGTLGQGDIWVARKKGKAKFEDAKPLGATINSIYDENSVYIHPDGKTLFFSSNRPGGLGGYDIYFSRFVDGNWTTPVNMGYPINSIGDESYFYLSTDGKTGFLTSRRPESIDYSYDIYEIDLSEYVFPDVAGTDSATKAPTVSIFKGKIMSKATAEPLSVSIELRNEQGEVVYEIESGENGNFLASVDGNAYYDLQIKFSGFKTYNERIFIPRTEGKTEYVIKVLLLENE